MKIYW